MKKKRVQLKAEIVRVLSVSDLDIAGGISAGCPSKPCTTGGCPSRAGCTSGVCSYEC